MIPSSRGSEVRENARHGQVRLAEFNRPTVGPNWNTGCPHLGRRIGWVGRGNQASTRLEVTIPTDEPIERIRIYGVFARIHAESIPRFGETGIVVGLYFGESLVRRIELGYARHYVDARDISPKSLHSGDGCRLDTLGAIEIDGEAVRLDRFSIEPAMPEAIDRIEVIVTNADTEIAIFDVEYDVVIEAHGCPFHTGQKGVALAEIPAIVRIGDRAKLRSAIAQLSDSLPKSADLDEARGQALTFIAVLAAAFLERDADRSMHRTLLDAAREMESAVSIGEVVTLSHGISMRVAAPLFAETANPTIQLMNEAMRFVDRNFAREISDDEVASMLGLSTSHFRHLFREATGQPFHRYLISVRLEHARRMLVEQGAGVAETADAVGFQSASHFSRAFTQRFGANPNQLRRKAG